VEDRLAVCQATRGAAEGGQQLLPSSLSSGLSSVVFLASSSGLHLVLVDCGVDVRAGGNHVHMWTMGAIAFLKALSRPYLVTPIPEHKGKSQILLDQAVAVLHSRPLRGGTA
jgi:hypothetical protein